MYALIGIILLQVVFLHSFLHNLSSNWARHRTAETNKAFQVASFKYNHGENKPSSESEYRYFANYYVHRSEKENWQVPVFGSNGQQILSCTFVPSPETFPSMLYRKQLNAAAPNVLFERVSAADQFVIAECVRRMLGGETVGIIGSAGVGKSTLVNQLHMKFWDEMMKSRSELKYMFVRIDGELLRVSIADNRGENNGDEDSDDESVPQTINVHHCKEAGSSFATHMEHILRFIKNNKLSKRRIVLIAEFTENELTNKQVDLEVSDLFGVVFIAANDDIEFLVKFMKKAGDTNFYLIDRLTDEQAEKCCEVMYQTDPTSCEWGIGPDGVQLSAADALAVVRQRIHTVGPILRYVACSEAVYLARVEEMETNEVERALSTMSQMTEFRTPEPSSLLVSLSLRPHVTRPNTQFPYKQAAPEYYQSHRDALSEEEWNRRCYQRTFLSEGAKARVLKALSGSNDPKLATQLALLERLNLAHPLEEFVVKHALCLRRTDPVVSTHFAVDQWQFCIDPGRRAQFTTDMLLSPERVKEIKRDLNTCVREERSAGDYIVKSAREMEYGVLYSSSSGDMVLGDYCFINKNRTIVTYVHVGRSDPEQRKRPFSTASLHTILFNHGLGPGQDSHDTCKLRLVYVTNWNDATAANRGIALTHTDSNSTPNAKRQLDFPEWENLRAERATLNKTHGGLEETGAYPPEDMDWIPSKVERIIVRARTRPGMSLVPLKPAERKAARKKTATRKAI